MKRINIGDRIFIGFIYVFLTLLAFSAFYPFWNSLVISFNEGMDTSKGGVTFWVREFTLENYKIVFEDSRLMGGFVIATLRTVIGTVTAILATSIFAYGMSKRELMGRKYYMIMCIITMYFGGGLIPSYMLIRSLGLFNSFWVFIIPALVSVWNMIIFRTFFQGLPQGLEESAKIDGCGYWGTFVRIVLPLSGPVIATLSLFTAVNHWNEWFVASIYITKEELMPIQTILRQILFSNIASEQLSNVDASSIAHINSAKKITSKSLTMATIMVATIPIVCVYPFLQRFFVKGVLVGSLKE
ncbi:MULTISPECIES: carbohydrate ABC transporter permease [Paenibacillus]|jgi:putative aldouronate transport system permease protein|uniref:ABC transporter permease n=1 Tax=Paenibacillus odorifer TaxID=189426 RepID=A0A1R0WTW2_9BACL|nr:MULTISPECIES: carbohydrate ABC transporter permease [Paenibacillus]AIQ74263.1 ABC transporter permease [Paenibacillus odorifer]AWV33581.1 carbohydrate ABC transporter permease [Paenibacillus odorifer]ETT66089.1 binding-protein-dependent transport systems inner membrane component [Paenibacillus sp. FSL H8-237]MDH6427153.1 putative aldouronate transport system permease protein [Paenibacillus sp. PastH-4]MDH6443182.1 putative aldouronate transport system permease protein [Paenibacillus sp. Pas